MSKPSDGKDVSVYVSSLIAAPVSDVWKIVGPYDKLDSWVKLDSCTLEPDSGQANQVASAGVQVLADL